jgi:hypothetical protein
MKQSNDKAVEARNKSVEASDKEDGAGLKKNTRHETDSTYHRVRCSK